MTLPPFYPILDTALLEQRGLALADAAEALLEAGARILQVRHKGDYTRDMLARAREVVEMCRAAGALPVINDRADIAVILDTAVHIGQDDLPVAAVRNIVGTRTLGYSTHNEFQLESAELEPVDYTALGPVFGTRTKHNPDPSVGLDEFRRLRPICTRPLVAIGGITRQSARSVFDAGADSVAIISDLFPDVITRTALRERAQEWIDLTR